MKTSDQRHHGHRGRRKVSKTFYLLTHTYVSNRLTALLSFPKNIDIWLLAPFESLFFLYIRTLNFLEEKNKKILTF